LPWHNQVRFKYDVQADKTTFMQRFIIRRILYMFVALVAATLFVFLLGRAQGDPRNLLIQEGGYGVTQETWDLIGKQLHLDKPLVVQYLIWLGKVLSGDLGESVGDRIPVARQLSARIWPTVSLAAPAWILAIIIGTPLGILSSISRGSVADYIARGFALVGQAAPQFWLALMGILVFAVHLRWVPVATPGEGFAVRNYILPVIVLGLGPTAAYLRLTRSAMLNVLDTEYIKLARAKGVGSGMVIWKHGFRNAVIPSLTLSTLVLAGLITGSIVIETVFAWPGIGRLAFEAVSNGDFPVVTGTVLFFTLFYLVLNFITDLMYVVIDPRIKLE
jgi:peptide/nickel transport system permease protein